MTSPPVGLTRRQAASVKALIAIDLALLEQVAEHMVELVTDHKVSDEQVRELAREVAHQLNAIVDRRTRL